MGSGAVRSQMDVRICLRVRERRDVDLILGQGMLAAGWAAHTLNAPGKFLLSTPEHTTPRRARAYRLDDNHVAAIAARHAPHRPQLDAISRQAADPPGAGEEDEGAADEPSHDDAAAALRAALQNAPEHGHSVKELMAITGMGRSWVYARLQAHALTGDVTQITRGRWRWIPPTTAPNRPHPGEPHRPRGRPRRRNGPTRRRARATDVHADESRK